MPELISFEREGSVHKGEGGAPFMGGAWHPPLPINR
jgi:hypothetical protein